MYYLKLNVLLATSMVEYIGLVNFGGMSAGGICFLHCGAA